jgi:hypothetical protein
MQSKDGRRRANYTISQQQQGLMIEGHHQPQRDAAGNFIVFWPRARLIIIALRGARIRPNKRAKIPSRQTRESNAFKSDGAQVKAAHTKWTFYSAHSTVQNKSFLLKVEN